MSVPASSFFDAAEVFGALFDDAAVFPPGDLPLPRALPAHREHRSAWYAPFVGCFVSPAARVEELTGPLTVSLTLPAGPQDLPRALERWALTAPGVLQAVEVVLPEQMPAAEALAVLDAHLPGEVTGFLEIPRGARGQDALDALVGTRHLAKFRTGGLVPEAHPDELELSRTIIGAVERGLPFKCTAGLHHAVRHTDGALEQHGFLNVLLATDAALRGGQPAELAEILAERSPQAVAGQVAVAAEDGRLARARARFLSFGTCSITDPVTDLVALGLVHRPEETDA
ncbi:hypothetical protein GXW82_01605 [Streptacidiphilus sp. 4-A2]|nr:hypothetical protein [Streptacidiphilus sp. 4-A2]